MPQSTIDKETLSRDLEAHIRRISGERYEQVRRFATAKDGETCLTALMRYYQHRFKGERLLTEAACFALSSLRAAMGFDGYGEDTEELDLFPLKYYTIRQRYLRKLKASERQNALRGYKAREIVALGQAKRMARHVPIDFSAEEWEEVISTFLKGALGDQA